MVGALLAAVDGREYYEDGGWRDLIDDALCRAEYVVADSIMEHTVAAGEHSVQKPPAGPSPKSKPTLFITDEVMAQNGYCFTSGMDTYNGTPRDYALTNLAGINAETLLDHKSQVPGELYVAMLAVREARSLADASAAEIADALTTAFSRMKHSV